MKRRVELIMNRNKKASKIGTVAAVLASVILSGTTVFAYTPMQTVDDHEIADITSGYFDFDYGDISEDIFSNYNYYFEDMSGNIIPLDDSNFETRAILCTHNYESGYVNHHVSQSNGGCVINRYEAKHCMKCNHYVLIKLVNTITYAKCIHK